jgi:cytochrome c oxidase subunit II
VRRLADGSLDPQGPAAESMADLWWLMLWLGVAVFVVFAVALSVGLFRPRPSDEDETRRGSPGISDRWFTAGGLLFTAIVLVVFVATIAGMRALPSTAPPEALVVEIVGHQWWWEVHYPDEGITTANEVHIPVGRPVAVEVTAADVIHSFWVPRLGGKMDMLPDRTNTLVLEADEPGVHHSQCAEFCGLGHAEMALTVVAESEEDFASWVAARRGAAEQPADEIAQRGFAIFVSSDCADCHAVQGTTADSTTGPDLTHFASRRSIGAGVLSNTRENLADWITDPDAFKSGVKMPATDLSDEELDALLTYLEGLE